MAYRVIRNSVCWEGCCLIGYDPQFRYQLIQEAQAAGIPVGHNYSRPMFQVIAPRTLPEDWPFNLRESMLGPAYGGAPGVLEGDDADDTDFLIIGADAEVLETLTIDEYERWDPYVSAVS